MYVCMLVSRVYVEVYQRSLILIFTAVATRVIKKLSECTCRVLKLEGWKQRQAVHFNQLKLLYRLTFIWLFNYCNYNVWCVLFGRHSWSHVHAGYATWCQKSSPTMTMHDESYAANHFFLQEWPKWKCWFEQYRQAAGLASESEERQVSTLLYCLGEDAEDVLDTTRISAEDKKYAKVV